MSSSEMVAYTKWLELIREGYNRLGRGAQQEAAFDIRVSPSMVSSVLKGRYVSPPVLQKLEDWLTDKMSHGAEEAPSANTGAN